MEPSPIIETINTIPFATVALFGFYCATGIYLIFTTVLYFHWHEYSTDSGVSRMTALAYACTTLPLITILGVATLSI